MKLKSLLAIAIVATFAFSSCKKDYTCNCTVNGVAATPIEITKAKKSDATDYCTKLDTEAKAAYSAAGIAASCELKSK